LVGDIGPDRRPKLLFLQHYIGLGNPQIWDFADIELLLKLLLR